MSDAFPRQADPPGDWINSAREMSWDEIRGLSDERQQLVAAAMKLYRMRRARDRILPAELVGEPAWDMLLALYSDNPSKLTVSSVCFASGVPVTTAMRWIRTLAAMELVERTRHDCDGRSILLALTEKGRVMVERCLKAMLRFGCE